MCTCFATPGKPKSLFRTHPRIHSAVVRGLQGSVSVNDTIELPALRVTKQVKSIQMFRQPVPRAVRGDRAGVCVTQLDAGLMERGLAAAPGTVPTFSGAIAAVDKVRFFAGRVGSKSKFHVSVGHATVMAEIQVRRPPPHPISTR